MSVLVSVLKTWSHEKPIEEVEHWRSNRKTDEPQEHLFADVEVREGIYPGLLDKLLLNTTGQLKYYWTS